MTLAKILEALRESRTRLDQAIAVIEPLIAEGSASRAVRQQGARRGGPWDDARRLEQSKRMRKAWDVRRAASAESSRARGLSRRGVGKVTKARVVKPGVSGKEL